MGATEGSTTRGHGLSQYAASFQGGQDPSVGARVLRRAWTPPRLPQEATLLVRLSRSGVAQPPAPPPGQGRVHAGGAGAVAGEVGPDQRVQQRQLAAVLHGEA